MARRGRQKGIARWVATPKYYAGRRQYKSGNTDAAYASFHQAAYLLRNDSSKLRLNAHIYLGRLHGMLDQPDSVLYYFTTAIRLAKQYGMEELTGSWYANIGLFHTRRGNYIQALDAFFKGITLMEQYDNPSALAYVNFAGLFEHLGLTAEAHENFAKAYEIYRQKDDPTSFVEACIVKMQMASSTEEIEAYAQKGLNMTDSLNLKRSEVFLLINAGHLLADSLAVEPATHYLRRCVTSARAMGYKEFEYVAKLYLAKVLSARASYNASIALCRAVRPFFAARNDHERLLILNEVCSSSFEALGQLDSAYHYLKRREAADHALHNRELTKQAVSQYWAYKTAQEKKLLTLQKQHAEQQAQQAHSQTRYSTIILGLVGLLLLFVMAVFYLRYSQKQQHTEDLKALNQSLVKEREKLSRINSKLNRFSSIVSHDILANLDLILTTGNVMAGSASSGTNLPRYYEMTQHTARELKSYCLKLLREAKNGNARPQTLTHPTPILEKVLARYETRLLQAGYKVETTPLSAAPLSETQIEQLFQNLVSNALRHAAEVEHPKLFITEKQDKNGRYWVIEDNGPGLTDEMKRTVFEPKTSPRSNGVGQQVGLSLLHDCLAESGVALTVEDADMGGARFIIRF